MSHATRHLDAAISILGGGGKPKRKSSGPIITIYDLGAAGVSVQFNGKEVWLAPDMERARADANRRADTMQNLRGVRPTIQEF